MVIVIVVIVISIVKTVSIIMAAWVGLVTVDYYYWSVFV